MLKVKPKKLLYIALLVSVILHLIFGITVESYLKFLLKKAPLTGDNEKYFEILPFVPKEIPTGNTIPQNAKFYGPKNISPAIETAPKTDKFIAPKVLERLLSQPKPKEEKSIVPNLPTLPPESAETAKNDVTKKEPAVVKKPFLEKKLPSIERLIPKTPDLIAKMPKEESINLNRGTVKEGKELVIATKEYKYWSYLDKMKRKIELLWQYPEVARVNGLSGALKIAFAVDKSGKLKDVVLIESSGYKFFDDAALKALKDASPFAPFPDTWDVERLNIEGTFIYEIKVIR